MTKVYYIDFSGLFGEGEVIDANARGALVFANKDMWEVMRKNIIGGDSVELEVNVETGEVIIEGDDGQYIQAWYEGLAHNHEIIMECARCTALTSS